MIKPFGRQILIEPIKEEGVSSADQTLSCYGNVIDIGSDVVHFKVGDKIAYLDWGRNWVDINDTRYHFIIEDDKFILGYGE